MSNTSGKSDLIDRVHHEHHHLTRLFRDINETFEKIAAGEIEGDKRQEVVESAAGDLRVGLDEMLHHFDQEEEVFFVEIEKRFPELSEDIGQLVSTHESICEQTRTLQRYLSGEPANIAEVAEDAQEIIETIKETLAEHTREENRIFGEALRKMSPDEREALLLEMQKI